MHFRRLYEKIIGILILTYTGLVQSSDQKLASSITESDLTASLLRLSTGNGTLEDLNQVLEDARAGTRRIQLMVAQIDEPPVTSRSSQSTRIKMSEDGDWVVLTKK